VTTGRLVLVATPIGNLGDLSPRAVQALAEADAIACEDTRRTGLLLQKSGIERTRLLRADEHTEAAATAEVVMLLQSGATVAVVTDAGTPGISDPGGRLVRAAIAAGARVTAVPGPSAAVTALVLSGLPSERWVMEGFLPRQGRGREERLREVAAEPRTIVLYEAPHRLRRTLADLLAACGGERAVVLARELTKLHEEVWRGTLAEAVARPDDPRGEYVVVLAGAEPPAGPSDDVVRARLHLAMEGGATRRDAAATVADELGIGRNRAYELALGLDR
jgi:16S rRNA (cytidine1402-2'-O)-methyltransferase